MIGRPSPPKTFMQMRLGGSRNRLPLIAKTGDRLMLCLCTDCKHELYPNGRLNSCRFKMPWKPRSVEWGCEKYEKIDDKQPKQELK